MVRTLLLALTSFVAAVALAPAMSAESVLVVAALAAATTLLGVHAPATVPDATLRALRPRRRAATVPLVLAGRTTDVGRHPVRPRAPGLV